MRNDRIRRRYDEIHGRCLSIKIRIYRKVRARGFDLGKCGLKDKMLMNLLKIKLEKAPDTDEDAKGMLACYEHPADFTSRDTIKPILDCIKNIE